MIEGLSDLRRDLVDFVDIDDAALRPLDIVIGGLQQLQDDVLDVLADIAGFGQRGGVGHGEGHVEDARQGLRQQRLAGAGRADQQDVGLGQFDVVVLRRVVQTLVVVVHGHREHALGLELADHVIVEDLADFLRRRNAVAGFDQRGLVLLTDDVHAEFDAFIADEHRRPGNQLAHLVLALAAERAIERVFRVAIANLAHKLLLAVDFGPIPTALFLCRSAPPPTGFRLRSGELARLRAPVLHHVERPNLSPPTPMASFTIPGAPHAKQAPGTPSFQSLFFFARIGALVQHFIDQAKILGLVRRHEMVAIEGAFDGVVIAAGVCERRRRSAAS